MGMTIQEYLKEKAACQSCEDQNQVDFCVTTLLSRIDICLIYNAIEYNSNPFDNTDVLLLQNLRANLSEEQVVDYYVRSERLLKKIHPIHGADVTYWEAFYTKYVADIVQGLKTDNHPKAVGKIYAMLMDLESTEIV